MANRRMFNKELVSTDKFLDMPVSSQLLFFHLGMNADDEGFVSSPKRIQRIVGCSEDDLKILIGKQFIVGFESGVIVITDWNKHNQLRRDRFTPTLHTKEKQELQLIDFKGQQPNGNQMATDGKPSIVEYSIVENSIVNNIQAKALFDFWNIQTSTTTHRVLKKDIESAYNSLLSDGYKDEEITTSIKIYNEALSSNKSWLNHKWTLKEFLTQQNACRKFIDCNGDYNWLIDRQEVKNEQRSNEAY